MYSQVYQAAKSTFLGFIPNAKRSLAKNSESEEIGDLTTAHIAMVMEQLITIPDMKSVVLPHGAVFEFSKTLKEKYEEWECSGQESCLGVFISGVEVYKTFWFVFLFTFCSSLFKPINPRGNKMGKGIEIEFLVSLL